MSAPSETRARRDGYGWSLLLPLGLLWVLAYFVPLLFILVLSVSETASASFVPLAFTLDNYGRFIGDGFYQGVFLRTVNLALATTLLTLVLGLPLAVIYTLVGPVMQRILLVLIISPTLISAVVRSYGWMIVLGGSGAVNSLLQDAGLIDRPIRFLFSFLGVMIGLTQLLLPFMVLPIISVLRRQDPLLTEAATNLGATRSQVLLRVTVPLSLPGILAGGALVFILAYSHFAVPQLLGGGAFLVVSTLIYQQATAALNYGAASALSVVLLVSAVLFIFVWAKVLQRFAGSRGVANP